MRAEEQQPDGGTSVTLSCSSHSNPPVKHYLWYKKNEKDDTQDQKLFDGQNYTVYSDKPGIYYCVAKNEINQTPSDPVSLFDREWIQGCVSVCGLFIAFRRETCWWFCEFIHLLLSSLDLSSQICLHTVSSNHRQLYKYKGPADNLPRSDHPGCHFFCL